MFALSRLYTRTLFMACCFLLVFFAEKSLAADVASDENKTIRVGFSAFPPFRFETPDGKPTGIEVDFVNELLHRMNLTPVFVHAPFVRNLKMMETGDIDLMIGVLRRPEREAYMQFIDPPYSTGAKCAFFMLKERCSEIKSYEDLYGKTIGVSNGVAYFKRFDDDVSLNKYKVRNIYQNMDKLLKGRIDVFISEEFTAKYMLFKRGAGNRIGVAKYKIEVEQSVYLTLSKMSQFAHRENEFSKVLKVMNDEKVCNEIGSDFFKNYKLDVLSKMR